MDIDQLLCIVVEWADEVFPNRTPTNCLTKLVMEELPELLQDQTSEGEYADCLLLMLDYAYLVGIDPGEAVLNKMKVNKERKWKVNETTGLLKHLKE